MLLNLRIFKKLVKEAYNGGGLIVGREGEEYILCDGSWIIRIKEEAFEKEYKAAVIEHVGDLPRDGELVRKSKKFGNSEMSEASKAILTLEDIERACVPADITSVYIDIAGKLCRMVQCNDRNVLVKEELIVLAEEVKGEGMEGPCCIAEKEFQLYWSSRTCKYTALAMNIHQETKEWKALERLRAVDLRR